MNGPSESCCQNKFNTRKEFIEDEMKKEAANIKKEVEEDFGTGKFAKYQRCLWDLIEKPHTSTAAKVRDFRKFVSLKSILYGFKQIFS